MARPWRLRDRIDRQPNGELRCVWILDLRDLGLGEPTFPSRVQAETYWRGLGRRSPARELERSLLPLVVELRARGVETPNRLARELNARAIKTSAGCNWRGFTVKRLFEASGELLRQARLEEPRPHILGRRSTRRGRAVTAAAIKAKKEAADQRSSVLLPLIVEMRHSGETALRKAAAKLNDSGHTAPRGGQCCAMTVKRALARRKRVGFPITRGEQDGVRRAQAVKYDQCLERRLGRLIDRGWDNTVALSRELNRRGWLNRSGQPWGTDRLGDYVKHHLPAIWSLIRTQVGDPVVWQEIEARFIEAEQRGVFTLTALAEFFNEQRQRTASGQGVWSRDTIEYARRRLGRAQSEETRSVRLAHAKRIHDGLARREGINREPFDLRRRAAKMAAKGVVTPMGLPLTEGRLRAALYRDGSGRRHERWFSAERAAEFDALVAAGKGAGEIAWELNMSKKAVESRREMLRRRNSNGPKANRCRFAFGAEASTRHTAWRLATAAVGGEGSRPPKAPASDRPTRSRARPGPGSSYRPLTE
jgi:hypothetical protein